MNYQALYFWKSLKGHLSDFSRNKSARRDASYITFLMLFFGKLHFIEVLVMKQYS